MSGQVMATKNEWPNDPAESAAILAKEMGVSVELEDSSGTWTVHPDGRREPKSVENNDTKRGE